MPRTTRLSAAVTALTALTVTALSPGLANASAQGIRERVLASTMQYGVILTLYREDTSNSVYAVLEDDVIPGDKLTIFSNNTETYVGPWEVKNPNQLLRTPTIFFGCGKVAAGAWVGPNKTLIHTRFTVPC